jgi:hypothetical protein
MHGKVLLYVVASYATNTASQKATRTHRVAARQRFTIDPTKAVPQRTPGRTWGQVPGARDAFRGRYHRQHDPQRQPPTLPVAYARARARAHNAKLLEGRSGAACTAVAL